MALPTEQQLLCTFRACSVVLFLALATALALVGCESQLGIDRAVFECDSDSECGEGFVCDGNRCRSQSAQPEVGGCEAYCDDYLEHCGADVVSGTRVFRTKSECLEVCAKYPADGDDGDQAGNSLQCRLTHLGLAVEFDPGTHCPHASPDGAGTCGSRTTRPCLDYCAALVDLCEGELFPYNNARDCLGTCADFRKAEEDEVGPGDTLECRRRRMALIAEDGPSKLACGEAGGNTSTTCVEP